jgi:hypothetical protein
MTRTNKQLAYDAKSIRLQLKGLQAMVNEIDCYSLHIDTELGKLYDDDNDTFIKVHNQINSIYDAIYSTRANIRDFSRNHFESYLHQESL